MKNYLKYFVLYCIKYLVLWCSIAIISISGLPLASALNLDILKRLSCCVNDKSMYARISKL